MSTNIPERWVTGKTRVTGFIDGPDESMWHAHREAGKPADIATFRAGFEAGIREEARNAAKPAADVVQELTKAHRLIYLLNKQLSTMGRSAYARAAHAEGLIKDDLTRETERAAVLARAGGAS